MGKLLWTEQNEIGVEAIDEQHRMIVDYINRLNDAYHSGVAQKRLGQLVDDLVDHTIRHFNYEESLLENSGYPFLKAHKKSHVLFAKNITDFQTRFKRGEGVSREVESLLATWFFDHLKHDDTDYVEFVREYLRTHPEESTGKKGFFSRFFK